MYIRARCARVWMNIQRRRPEGVLDNDPFPYTDVDSAGGHQLGVQLVELAWVGVGPHGQSIDAPNQLKSLVEGSDYLLPIEAIRRVAKTGQLRFWLGQMAEGRVHVVHSAEYYHRALVL